MKLDDRSLKKRKKDFRMERVEKSFAKISCVV